MTLENTLLEKLNEWQPPAGRHDLHVGADGWNVTVTADRSDVLGCLLWELTLHRDGSAGLDVQQWARAAAERITGLMEPLKIVEVDTVRQQAQLRSDTPVQRGGKRLYYELMLSGIGHAVLRRFQTANAGASREQVVFAVTHETLAKVVADLADTAIA